MDSGVASLHTFLMLPPFHLKRRKALCSVFCVHGRCWPVPCACLSKSPSRPSILTRTPSLLVLFALTLYLPPFFLLTNPSITSVGRFSRVLTVSYLSRTSDGRCSEAGMANMILLDEGRVTMGEGCAAAKGQEPGNKGMCGILCCEGVKKEQGRQKGREKAGSVITCDSGCG